MKIQTELLENITPSSNPDQAAGGQAPKFGRSAKFLEDETIEETTTSGAIATNAAPVGGMQRRGKGSIFSGIKTSKKFANSDAAGVTEEWSKKYKSSINCSHPKGFSQKAHCAGKKKHNESITTEMVCEDCGMCQTHGNLIEIKKGSKDSNGFTKCWSGKHAEGTKKGKNGGQVRDCVSNQGVAEAKPSATTIAWDIWNKKSPDDQQYLKKLHPNLKIVGKPTPVKEPKTKPAPIDYAAIARKAENVWGQIFPDGDPVDWMYPYLKRMGIPPEKQFAVLNKAIKMHVDKKGYYHWLEQSWDGVARDKLMPDVVTLDNNPWRENWQGMAEAKADPLGPWIAHKNGTEAKQFKTREGAKKYVASHEGFTINSSERFHDTYRKKKDIAENSIDESEISENDLILKPGISKRLKPGFVSKADNRIDREVEMALVDLKQANKNSKAIYLMLQDVPEEEGIEGWVQEKIIKASDYLKDVKEYLEGPEVSSESSSTKRLFTAIKSKELNKNFAQVKQDYEARKKEQQKQGNQNANKSIISR